MRPAVFLTQLALWASSTHAFFIYTPEWMAEGESGAERRSVSGRGGRHVLKQRTGQNNRPAPKRAADDVNRLLAKYAGRRTAKVTDEDALAKRANQYQIMKAEEPEGQKSAGIDQDGTDYSYFVEAKLGSKGKTMYMLVDTGAGSSWVMGSTCKSKACGMHATFGPEDSTSLVSAHKPFTISYGSGKVSGDLVTDTISLAGMKFSYQFGLASTTSDQFVQFAFDGILGLAMNDGANENFLNVMDQANEVESNIFCVALNRASDGVNEGEISFGATNPDKFSGNITYTAISHEDDWAIQIDDMSYDGKAAGAGGVDAYIDTGTSFMFGPPGLVKKVHANIPGASSSDGTTYTVPCDSKKPIVLTFSGVDYEVSPKDWISPKNSQGLCTSNVYGHEVVEGAWLLGDTFLKNVYAVFDKDKMRIGFANNAITDGSSAKTSDAATKTSSSDDSSASSSGVTALADSTATAALGLGKETVHSTADASTASETKDSSSPWSPLHNAKYSFIPCFMALFALLA